MSSADLPLSGRTIVITRARSQAESFADQLEHLGARVLSCPTIEIVEPDSYELLDETLDHLYGYDWLIFTSANAVDYFFRRFFQRNQHLADIDTLRVCAIGDATAERLRELMVHVDVVPTSFKAEGVFSALKEFVGGEEQLVGLNFLLPRAAVARDVLPKALEAAGARVDVVAVYKTIAPEADKSRVAALLAGSADCVAFTSASTVRNLAQLFDTSDLGSILPNVAVACIGDITAQTATEFGLSVDIKPSQFTIPDLVQAIAAYYRKA